MRRLLRLAGCMLIAGAIIASAASAAQLRLSQAPGAQFPNRAFLLSLSTRASLTPSEVAVTENGAPVNGLSVESASAVGQSHFGTVLLIDASRSMNGTAIQNAVKAANSFVQSRSRSQPVGVIFFNQTPLIAVPMTTDSTALSRALAGTPLLQSGTRIFDAASAALQMLASAHITGGSIVLLSDGQDTGSHITQAALAKAAKAQGVRVYAIGVRDRSFDGRTLQSVAASTNGTYQPVDSKALVQLFRGLGVELSNQYLIRYRSIEPLAHAVRVNATVPGFGAASASYKTPALPPIGVVSPVPLKHTSFWTSTTGALVVSLVCAMLLGIAVMALIRTREGVRARVGGFVTATSFPNSSASSQLTLVQRALGDPRLRRERSARMDALVLELDVARIEISPIRLALLTALGTIFLGWLLVSATSSPVAVIVALAVPVAVRIGIRFLANRQRRQFEEQLPDNLQVVSSALRAGHTFVGALGVMSEDAPEPSRRELRQALADEQLGVPLVDTLNRIGKRMESIDFQQVTLVATLQRDTGGNTAEVIDLVTDTIRDRLDLRRLVRSLTAQGRLAGGVLSGLPVALLIAISVINPSYTHPLFHKAFGIVALVVALLMVISGAAIIRRIVNIEI